MAPSSQSTPPRTSIPRSLWIGCGCLLVAVCTLAGLAAFAAISRSLTRGMATDSSYEPAWSPDGTQIAFYSQRDGTLEVYVMQSDGTNETRLTGPQNSLFASAHHQSPEWSPDGQRLAFVSDRGAGDGIYIMDKDGSNIRQLTESRSLDADTSLDPDWSPDGQQIVFVAELSNFSYGMRENDPPPTSELYVVGADGGGLTRLTQLDRLLRSPKWSPDGGQIAFVLIDAGISEIFIMNADGTNLQQVTDNSVYIADLDWSPDGRRFAVTAGDIFQHNIFTMNVDGSDLRQLTDTSGIGDSSPSWSPDGRSIVFDSKLESRLVQIFRVDADGSNLVQLTGE